MMLSELTPLLPRIIDTAMQIQQVAAPTFQETARAEFMRQLFNREGTERVESDAAGNVYALLRGRGQASPLVVSAHLDTVFREGVDLKLEVEREAGEASGRLTRILGPGIGDNALGLAGLLGLLWAVRDLHLELPGDVWLAANVCEEGLGDLKGMKTLIQQFMTPAAGLAGVPPLAYIVLEGMALGSIYHRAVGVQRYRIEVETPGGHSWQDYGQPSAIHELARLSNRIAAFKVPENPRSSLNIGVISGGSSVNTIAASAMLELDLRSEAAATLAGLAKQVEQAARQAVRPGIQVRAQVIGQRPAGEIPSGHPLVELAVECLRMEGIQAQLKSGSTDANLPLSLGLPSLAIGLTSGGRSHTVHEYINVQPLEKGFRQLVRLVSQAWEALSKAG
jgi:tripeptide aminopeptidase